MFYIYRGVAKLSAFEVSIKFRRVLGNLWERKIKANFFLTFIDGKKLSS